MKTELLLEFAKLAATTYDNPKDSKAKFKALGYTIVQFFDIDGAQAYLLTNGTITVLSFRGTEVTQKSDVLADLKAGKNLEACGGKVHVGFKGEINKLWPSISAALAANPGNVYVTGHSLGAAMATIAASRIQDRVTALQTISLRANPVINSAPTSEEKLIKLPESELVLVKLPVCTAL